MTEYILMKNLTNKFTDLDFKTIKTLIKKEYKKLDIEDEDTHIHICSIWEKSWSGDNRRAGIKVHIHYNNTDDYNKIVNMLNSDIIQNYLNENFEFYNGDYNDNLDPVHQLGKNKENDSEKTKSWLI